jgi:hypothetical protein
MKVPSRALLPYVGLKKIAFLVVVHVHLTLSSRFLYFSLLGSGKFQSFIGFLLWEQNKLTRYRGGIIFIEQELFCTDRDLLVFEKYPYFYLFLFFLVKYEHKNGSFLRRRKYPSILSSPRPFPGCSFLLPCLFFFRFPVLISLLPYLQSSTQKSKRYFSRLNESGYFLKANILQRNRIWLHFPCGWTS